MWAKSKPSGFTIVELLIVIVVIGILAAITILAYSGIQSRAKVAAVTSVLSQAATKLSLYYVDNANYPATLAAVGLQDSSAASYQYLSDNSAKPSYCLLATNSGVLYSVTSGNSTPYSGYCNSQNMVGWWPLNGNASDGSGGGNVGTVNGATITTGQNGQAGGAYTFNGSTNITVASTLDIGTANATISCWVYNPTSSSNGAFVKVGSTGGDGFGVGIGSSSFDVPGTNLVLLYESIRWIYPAAVIPVGWHHVVMTVDSSGQPSAYLDGNFIGTYIGPAPLAPAAQINIGGYGATRKFTGSLDDIRVYNVPLTASDVKTIYSAGAQ